MLLGWLHVLHLIQEEVQSFNNNEKWKGNISHQTTHKDKI